MCTCGQHGKFGPLRTASHKARACPLLLRCTTPSFAPRIVSGNPPLRFHAEIIVLPALSTSLHDAVVLKKGRVSLSPRHFKTHDLKRYDKAPRCTTNLNSLTLLQKKVTFPQVQQLLVHRTCRMQGCGMIGSRTKNTKFIWQKQSAREI